MQSLDYHQFFHQEQNYFLCHGNTRTQGCLGSSENFVQDKRFFSMNVNSKQIINSQDGKNKINGGFSYQQQTSVQPISWFWKKYYQRCVCQNGFLMFYHQALIILCSRFQLIRTYLHLKSSLTNCYTINIGGM